MVIMNKIVVGSAFLGTVIEVYDFTLFPFLIPILAEIFFPTYAKEVAINLTTLAYVVSYVVKPFGSVFFGYLIDFWGRQAVLLITTVLMTVATAAIAIVPPQLLSMYGGAGLILCRLIQGFSVSGEFSSAIIMAVEQGKKYPAFWGSFAFMGSSVGFLLANFSVYILLYVLPHHQIVAYAWRTPFLIGALGCLVLFGIRKRINIAELDNQGPNQRLIYLFKHDKKKITLLFWLSSLSASAYYSTFVFLPTWLSTSLQLYSHQEAILMALVALLVYLMTLPLAGLLADRIGITKQIKMATILYLLFSYAVFMVLPQCGRYWCVMILVFFAMIQALFNAVLPAFMVLQFDLKQRGRALAISYHIGLTVFGGLMPYLIVTSKHGLNPGLPISCCALLCLIFVFISVRDTELDSSATQCVDLSK